MNNDDDIKNEIDILVRDIKFYNELYFQQSISLISDYEYDKLVKRLEELESKYPQFKREDSPTNSVDEKPTQGFKKHTHDVPMLSLKKTYSFNDVNKFFKDVEKKGKLSFFCELKLDGVSINVNYKRGVLSSISTRGDGYIGDNITSNKFLFKNILEHIESLSDIEDVDIRGEALITFSDFKKINDILIKAGKTPLANPRNAASGRLKSLNFDNKEQQREITVFFYDIYFNNRLEKIKTRFEMNALLKEMNIPLETHSQYCPTENDVFNFITRFEHEKDNLDYPTDGVVIKVNELNTYESFGNTNKSPRWAIAFKYKPSIVCSKLINVEYQVGRSGIITPIANFEPVELAGTTVRRASLYNKQNIVNLDLHERDFIFIQKSGEIIPKVVGVDVNRRTNETEKVVFIKNCPSCNSCLEENNDIYFCTNENCNARIISSLTHFASKNAMNIKTLGTKLITLLVERGLVRKFNDLYKLRFRDISFLPGMNTSSTQKLLEEIKKSKDAPFSKFLFALGIDGIGEVVAQNIAKYYKSIEDLQKASMEDLINIDLIGEGTAKKLIESLKCLSS